MDPVVNPDAALRAAIAAAIVAGDDARAAKLLGILHAEQPTGEGASLRLVKR